MYITLARILIYKLTDSDNILQQIVAPATYFTLVTRFLIKMLSVSRTNGVVNNDTKYIASPSQRYYTYYIRNSLQRLFRLHFPDFCLRFIFTNSILFKHKYRIPDVLCFYAFHDYCCPV